MLLERTRRIIHDYSGRFMDGTISKEEFNHLSLNEFSCDKKLVKKDPMAKPTNEAHTPMEAMLDFVVTIAPNIPQVVLHTLNRRWLELEPDPTSRISEPFMRKASLAKYFLAYEACFFPKTASAVLYSDQLKGKLSRSKAIEDIHIDFINTIIWPAKNALLIHMAESKSTQLDNKKVEQQIQDIKRKRLLKANIAANPSQLGGVDMKPTEKLFAYLIELNSHLDSLLYPSPSKQKQQTSHLSCFSVFHLCSRKVTNEEDTVAVINAATV